MTTSAFLAAAVGSLACAVAVAAAQAPRRDTPPRQTTPPLILESLAGRDSFDRYCMTCHGRTGLGDGPLAAQLTTRPANLATLARRSGGTFPRQRVAGFIEGSTRVAGHGASEMPIWGRTFRALDTSDARVKVRLDNLVAYVESLQLGPAVPAGGPAARPTGAQLFGAYCATCHGEAGRGNGPLVGELRRRPPDLTKFTARNGGVFPAERVRRIVDGRDVASHGDPAMPVWGNVFSRSEGGEAAARERVQAIVDYLASIQERAAE
jgi:mono/diheme cytochrome c family protein